MGNNETQSQHNNKLDDIKVPVPELPKNRDKIKIVLYILLVAMFLAAGYFIYRDNLRQKPTSKAPTNIAPQEQNTVPVSVVKELLLDKHGKLQFLTYTEKDNIIFSSLPDSIKNLTAGAEEKTAKQIVFADGLNGYLLSLKYNNGDIVKVYENIVTAQESSDWERLILERSEKFAFGDLENSQFKARISLILENGKLSGEILVSSKK